MSQGCTGGSETRNEQREQENLYGSRTGYYAEREAIVPHVLLIRGGESEQH